MGFLSLSGGDWLPVCQHSKNCRWRTQYFQTTFYCKPSFIGQYLNFISNFFLSHKTAFIRALTNRAYSYCSNEFLVKVDIKRIVEYLKINDYPIRYIKCIIDDYYINIYFFDDLRLFKNLYQCHTLKIFRKGSLIF